MTDNSECTLQQIICMASLKSFDLPTNIACCPQTCQETLVIQENLDYTGIWQQIQIRKSYCEEQPGSILFHITLGLSV